jgi:NADH-quinone oxidoreductase subunit E
MTGQNAMLTSEEIREIEAEASHYADPRAASIEALKVVQKHRGWVSDECLKEVAPLVDMTPDELDGVATFYNLIFRRPVGKHVILVCDSFVCYIMGYEAMRDHLMDKLGISFGETTPDGLFTLLPMVCLGTCDHAPAMMVDEELYQDLTPEKIDEILEHYRKGEKK